jgi:hypothetical protein
MLILDFNESNYTHMSQLTMHDTSDLHSRSVEKSYSGLKRGKGESEKDILSEQYFFPLCGRKP